MGSCEMPKSQLPKPWRSTPLIESTTLSRAAGCRILLKLENIQPSGSFKSRGIGNLILSHIQQRQSSPNSTPSNLHFYSSSGGNAGLAAVTAARTLGYPCSVIVPSSTDDAMIAKLKSVGATEVVVQGNSWFFADKYLREEAIPAANKRGEEGIYVPPFDDPRIWDGASTMITEIKDQMNGEIPDGIVCSVGGGGLYSGIMQGLEKSGWKGKVQVAAVETKGAESLHAAVQAGELVTLPGITSIAKTLGAVRVCQQAFDEAWSEKGNTKSIVVSDAEACMACVRFADDERILVEPSCGASVALVYSPKTLREAFQGLMPESKVVIVVCGGSGVSLEKLAMYKSLYAGEVEMTGIEESKVSSNYTT